MNETADEIRVKRTLVKQEYRELFKAVSEILFRHDPIGINFKNNTDEYEPEVGTILPRLKDCISSANVLVVVHEEFQKWFDCDAGAIENYQEIAKDVWKAWLEHCTKIRRAKEQDKKT